MKRRLHIFLLVVLTFIVSCAEEQFAPPRQNDSTNPSPITVTNTTSCSTGVTEIKPKVDFLFLWDNSSSSVFINSQTKQALNNTIDLVSSRFDYHIMIAPLVSTSSSINNEARLVVEDPTGLNSSAMNMVVSRESAVSHIDTFTQAVGSYEEGVRRSVSMIKANISNGIFRPNSHVVIVVMSNQDDSSWHNFPVAASDRLAYVNEQSKQLLCLRGNYTPDTGFCTGANLNSLGLRFMSITAFNNSGTSCGGISFWNKGTTYQEVSKKVYLAPYNNGIVQNDQNTRSDGMYDAYDICSQSSFAYIFDGINDSIQGTLLSHMYDYWPVASASAAAIDPNEVRVFKNGIEVPRLFPPVVNGVNGFSFDNVTQTQNTRYAPTSGEPFSGYLVQLYGDSRVSYQDCIRVTTQTPKEFYDHVHMRRKPLEATIVLKINGVTIPQSSTNGWTLLKTSSGAPQFFQSFNIKASSGTPENRSGYFLQLNGGTSYSNGDQVEVSYDPAA